MKPKSIITVTAQSLPMILKYQGKEYVVKSTANGSLHMIKDSETKDNRQVQFEEIEIDPNPATVDLNDDFSEIGDETMGY